MDRKAAPAEFAIDRTFVRRLHLIARAWRWQLSEEDFASALSRSAAHRFKGESERPRASDVAHYLESLHLEDLALACACARGSEPAWEHFVRTFRPALIAAASSGGHDTRELADTLYAELYGVEERDGIRRPLFDYFHGRSTLGGWLRAVVAQRVVDRVRETKRFEPLPEGESAPPRASSQASDDPDPDRARLLSVVRLALAAALAGLLPRDRLRLALYYTKQLRLAAVGRLLGESEATVSRKLERTRRDIRRAVERRLREKHGLNDAEVAACYEYAGSDPAFDLSRALPPG